VLLGEIDLRGIAGWRGLNAILASALTGWRIRLEPVASTPAWRRLQSAMVSHRPVVARLMSSAPDGVRVDMGGLNARLHADVHDLSPGQELEVRVTRMDPDQGRIFVSDRLGSKAQLALF
jgi:hypothetical protein